MRHQLFLLAPVILAAARAHVHTVARASESLPPMSVATEYQVLVVATITLTMWLVLSTLIIRLSQTCNQEGRLRRAYPTSPPLHARPCYRSSTQYFPEVREWAG